MGSGKIHITRRVRGTTLTFDSMGRPKAIHSFRGEREMEDIRKRHASSMLKLLKKASLQERDILRRAHEQVGQSWEVQDEEDDTWNEMDLDTSEAWIDDQPQVGPVEGLMDELRQSNDNIDIDIGAWSRSKYVDGRTRSDRLLRQLEAWAGLYSDMLDAYLRWDNAGPPLFDEETYEGDFYSPITVYDIFESRSRRFPLTPGVLLVPTMVRYGYMGNAPLNPSCAFSLRLLELFRVMNSRCPQLSIHRFTRGLYDLQQTAYAPSLRGKFSSAYDAYLEVVARTSQKLQAELSRDIPDYRLKNACPACTFKVNDEPPMKYSMLIAIDGNNSLRRMPKAVRRRDENGKLVVSEYTERLDNRFLSSDLYLSNTEVDEFKDEVQKRLKLKSKPKDTLVDPSEEQDEGSPVDGIDQPTPCVDRWTNLSDESLKKMWGVFHETGIFLAVCRHGVALLLCDMIRSGELAKYPLALINKLVDTYGNNLMIGYDIGCGFSTTAGRSPKVGPKIHATQTRFCVGSFHGHAHARLCQLDWHPLYVEGCGLEDFETCERSFSESNSVAGATRHASTFHRRQAIFNHFNRWNMDKYAELSQFLVNNYRQSLQIVKDNTGPLAEMMRTLKISSSNDFIQWVHEEKQYLSSLKKPQQDEYEVLCIQYVKTLKKLEAAKQYFEVTSRKWVAVPISAVERSDFYESQSSATQSLEAAQLDEAKARGLDSVLTLQAVVRDLEIKLCIDEEDRWTSGTPQWIETEAKVYREEYQSAIDKLEGLVIARLFELSKLNQSGIGVKLRTHIAKALKARSKAIRKAIEDYNSAASKFQRPHLDIDTVLQYVALGEFDLLRESRHDIPTLPWMRGPERAAALLYFKLQRAKEEIARLNIEIKRLYAFMQAEEQVWEDLVSRLRDTQPCLMFQAAKRLKHLLSLNQVHQRRLAGLIVLDGYSGPFQIQNNHVERENSEIDDDERMSSHEETEMVMDATLQFVNTINE